MGRALARDVGTEARVPPRLAVLNVQRTCVHDGPGLRTTVFFRGCPLRCRWCQNPEAQAFVPPAAAGATLAIPEILAVVRRDQAYYAQTRGGVTLSGGEPLAQDRAALLDLLEALEAEGIPVAVETAGDVPWAAFQAVLPHVELFLFDLKVAGDDALHRDLTGRAPGRIRRNLRRLLATGAAVRIRTCVVPGLNDSPRNLGDMADLLRSLGVAGIELMRYHGLHEQKARRIGLPREPLGIGDDRSREALGAAAEAFRSLGIAVTLGAPETVRRPATFTPRVLELRRAIRDAGYQVCLESAELKTAFHRQHGFPEPLPVRRGRLLRYLLNHKTIRVHPGELLVGNYTSKRVGGNVWVEYFGIGMAATFWKIDRQTPVAFQCSRAEKLRLYTDLLPFWLRRGLLPHAFPSPRELALYAARALELKAGFNNNTAGLAHYIVNCGRLLRLGTRGIADEVRAAREKARDPAFHNGVLIALTALEEFAGRYAAHLADLAGREADPRRRAELEAMAQVCARVPARPARTFHEALQAILFLHVALCTESFENAISFGRLDQVLDPYFRADLAAGRIDAEAARELVACFLLKVDELIFLNDGDQAFQLGKLFESLSPVETVTIGGTDAAGADCTNDVTYMILDACELKPIGVNLAARIHRGSPARYVERIAEVYLNGSPMPALFNDDVYVPALQNEYPTSLEDARNFAIVGCVEPVACDDHFANTDAANVNVTLPLLQALRGDTSPLWNRGPLELLGGRLREALRARLGRKAGARCDPPATMRALLVRYRARLDALVREILADQQRIETALARTLTTPLASSLYRGCVASGKDAYEGGTRINTSGIQAVGITDVADSLHAIEQVVFQDRLCTIRELVDALDADFAGPRGEAIRRALLAVPKFGDDASPEPPRWVNRVMQWYVDALRAAPHANRDGKYVAGYYGLNANRVYGLKTPALPSGRKAGEPLANSICPHFGMQAVDLTSALNAVARVDFARLAPNGTTVTSTIDTGLFPGDDGVRNLAGLIRGYFGQGGMQFQPNLVDRELLLDAYRNPGKHKDLVVRIAGYCGYFDELSDELKREILNRSYYGAGPA